MVAVTAPNVFISKGYEGEAPLKYSQSGESVQFNVGWKVYDPKAEGESRWINLHIKAFAQPCERIKKMNLKEGSCVNLYGRLDEDVWTDKNTGEKKRRHTMILDNIEYAYTGSRSKDGQSGNGSQTGGQQAGNAGAAGGQQNGFAGPYMGAFQGGPVPQTASFVPPQSGQVSSGFSMPQQASQIPQAATQQTPQIPQAVMGNPMASGNFTGFEPFEGSNMFPT